MWLFPSVVILICSVNLIPAFAQRKSTVPLKITDNKKPLAVIPFQLKDNHLVIPVMVSGSTDTLRFIFDTGSEVTILHTGTAEKMRLNNFGNAFLSSTNNDMIKVPVATLNTLYLKELRMPYVNVYLEDLQQLGPVDGIIGIALLKAYIVKIDYQQQQLILYHTGRTPVGNTGRLLHFQLSFTTPVLDASIELPDGRRLPGHYHITTGGNYGILFNWPYVNKNKLTSLLTTINTDRVQDMIKTLIYINSSIPLLAVGGYNLLHVPVSYSKDINDEGMFTEIAGAIGYDVWKQFKLTINYNKKELYLEGNRIMATAQNSYPAM